MATTAPETEQDVEAIESFNRTSDRDDETNLEQDAEGVEEEDDGQLAIAGTRPNLTQSAGGRKPDISRSKTRAITLPTTGQFDKGEFLDITQRVRVKDVRFVDQEDAHGKIVQTIREHVLTPIAILDIGPSPAE